MSWRRLWHYGFLGPAILFILHQVSQKVIGMPLPFADAYLDPFCFGALVPHFLEMERAKLFRVKPLSKLDIAILALYLAILSEWLLPALSNRFTPDFFDVVSIFLGCFWFSVTFHNTHGRTIQKPV